MKVREIRELNGEEIKSKIANARKSIVEMRFQQATRKLESPAKLRQARKQLARLLTIQTEQENAATGHAGPADISIGSAKSASKTEAAANL